MRSPLPNRQPSIGLLSHVYASSAAATAVPIVIIGCSDRRQCCRDGSGATHPLDESAYTFGVAISAVAERVAVCLRSGRWLQTSETALQTLNGELQFGAGVGQGSTRSRSPVSPAFSACLAPPSCAPWLACHDTFADRTEERQLDAADGRRAVYEW